ncbi:penicillin acylase family protein [Meridianimarinicoccus roseus]|uniref:Penicillin acylase family protein n=1 Tax=Meridianimarinicoccus roseus TaxID=2072018 RepID=A0A2V2LGI3_9RHOB|nr:penicillin acylase family protein [Meridianimarinicoccus roseus]PWR04082.1 penicillin acylase family protein [Meridianimarinicoccus roseus]
MTQVFRWMLRLVTALLVVTGIGLGLAYYLVSRSLPDYDASYTVAGVTAPVRIVRDTAGVPHVFGATDEDSFFGLGFVHAQDRLWQMTMLRRTAQGRLSELFGARTLKIDETLRRFDLYRLASRSLEVQDASTRAALEAYSAGVNTWLATVNENALGRGAPEFFLFDAQIAPWQPADSLAIIKLMGLQLSSHLDREVTRARAALALPPERLRDLMPDVPGDGIAALPDPGWRDDAALRRSAVAEAAGPDFRDDPLSPFKRAAFAGASNVWAAVPARSTTGGTLLANDPHLGLTAPSIWYLAHIGLQDGGVIGGTIPGLPVVLAGRSDRLAWGLTTAYLDDLDVYLERLDPEDPARYLTPSGEYVPFRTESSVVRVKDAAPVTLRLRWTDRGPVLPTDSFGLAHVTPDGHVPSIAWTVLSAQDTSMSAAMALMRAPDVATGIAAMERHVAPAQNLMLVDRDHIALQMIGAMPRRSAMHNSLGRLPSPGWRAENHWQGTFSYDLNPRFEDPESGIIGNTNNKLIERPFPLHISHSWGDSQRITRWQSLMQDRPVHSRDSFVETQLDAVSPAARTLLPLMGRDLWFTGEAAPQGTTERRRRDALDLLAGWNGEMNAHRAEPLIYAAWVRALNRRLITDELGAPLAAEFAHPDPLFLERVLRDVDGAAAWCDVVQSAETEDCVQMSRLALDDALVWIDETFGGTLESLNWGEAHMAQMDHEVLGDVAGLGWLVNIRYATGGGDHTLMRGRTAGRGPMPFANVHGAAYRGVYDMADPDSSVFVISTGQSGHPFSRFYDNLGERWRRGEYIPMSLDPALAEAGAVGITVLEPRP